ncbi:MAG: CsbD family protein [Aeromicrobium sp.]|nr:CsbD family protein [Burkholderiales bacterium]
MNWDRIEGNWKQFKGNAQEQWGKLTDDQLDVIAGKRDHLVGKIQEAYGISKEVTEKQVADWLDRQKEGDRVKANMPANGPSPSVKRVGEPNDGASKPQPMVDPPKPSEDKAEQIHTIPS